MNRAAIWELAPGYYTATYGSSQLGLLRFPLQDQSGELWLSQIRLPQAELGPLAGQRLTFPCHPQPGYIDGCLTRYHQHHWVEVEWLAFGCPTAGQLPVQIGGRWQGATGEAEPILVHGLIWLPLNAEQLAGQVRHIVQSLAARTPRDQGRVMAALKHHLPYPEQLAEAAELVRQQLQP